MLIFRWRGLGPEDTPGPKGRILTHAGWIQQAAEQGAKHVLATADDADTQKLLAQPGIGLITAVTMRAGAPPAGWSGRFDRFRSGKQLARFCGVTPCNASSGKRQADSGLVKAGSRELRTVVIEAAKRLPRYVPKWKELRQRLGRTKPANAANAAVANRWLRWLYHQMVTTPALEQTGEHMAA